ncbi:hypothetical protein P4S64_19965 [Vibrio sp. M60_M31a]
MQKRINVNKLPADKGEAAWNSILGKQVTYSTIEKNGCYDWVIVGGASLEWPQLAV